MTEALAYPEDKTPEIATPESIQKGFLNLAANPTGGDKKIGALGQASYELMGEDAEIVGLWNDVLDLRNDPLLNPTDSKELPKIMLTTEIFMNLWQRCLMLEIFKQHNGIRTIKNFDLHRFLNFDYDFLEGFEDKQAWKDALQRIKTAPRPLRGFSYLDSLANNMSWRVINSNKQDRAAGAKLAISEYRGSLPDELRILEVGSSVGVGMSKILSKTLFERKTFYNATPAGNDALDMAINQPLELDYAINNDLFAFDNPNDLLWLIISSHYPSEFQNKKMLYEFIYLAAAKYPNMGFVRGDAGKEDFATRVLDEAKRLKSGGETRPNMATLFTVLYECTGEERQAIQNNVMQILDPSESSAIIIQDNIVALDDTQPFGVQISDNFRIPYNYKTAIVFPFSNDPTPKLIVEWETPRCKAGRLIIPESFPAGSKD